MGCDSHHKVCVAVSETEADGHQKRDEAEEEEETPVVTEFCLLPKIKF